MMCSVSLLAAYSAFDHVPPLQFFSGRERLVAIDLVDCLGDIGHDEQRRVVGRHGLDALVGEVHRMPALVEHEVQLVFDIAHLLVARRQLAVREPVQLHPLHHRLDALLVQEFQQLLVLGRAELRLVQQFGALVQGLLVRQQRLGLGDEIVDDPGLLADQLDYLGVVLRVLDVRLGPHGAGDDERRARFIDQDRVHLVDDGVVVRALHPLLQPRPPCCRAGSRSRTRCSCRR